MSIREEAVAIHHCGANCAQSVLCACKKYTGLEDATAMAVSGGFGAGVRCGEICGSVVGAVMAVGMNCGCAPDNAASKEKIASATRSITKEFSESHGCIRCQDLKKAGFSCEDLICYSAELAEKTIKELK